MPLYSRHLLPTGLYYALEGICRHHSVLTVNIEEEGYYKAIADVERKPHYLRLKVYLADVYTLTVDDVYEIMLSYPEVNCIVVISNWDHYTDSAKEEARVNGIGVFTLIEFFEALNYYEEDFFDKYIKKGTI